MVMKRAVVVVLSLLGLVVATSAPSAEANAKLACRDVSGTTVCRIDEPVVNHGDFVYQNVQIRPGDKVAVNAGGCVQTGGRGNTWKRYVNPSGPNSDHLYYGLIGVYWTGVSMRVSDAMKSGFTVGKQCPNTETGPRCLANKVDPTQLFLKVGYMDDDYGDNGYYNHDDGTEDQCRGSQNAWIEVTITHDPTVTWPPAPGSSNGIQDGDETDVDCGGGSAPACVDSKQCGLARDCKSGICAMGHCVAPLSCADVCTWNVQVQTCSFVYPDGSGGCKSTDSGRAINGISTPTGSTARLIKADRAATDGTGRLNLTIQACRSKPQSYQVIAPGYHLERAPNPDPGCTDTYRVFGRDGGVPIAPPRGGEGAPRPKLLPPAGKRRLDPN